MKPQSEAARRRKHAAGRAALIAALGWPPETLDQGFGERYAATTGELWKWVAERDGVEVADRISNRFG